LRISPEGTHSLLSVCYSAFRDRLTQTRDFQQSLFRLPRHLGVAALLRGVVTLLTVFEKSTTFFSVVFLSQTPPPLGHPLSRAAPLSSASAFRQRGAVCTLSSLRSQQPFFRSFPSSACPTPLRHSSFRAAPLPSASAFRQRGAVSTLSSPAKSTTFFRLFFAPPVLRDSAFRISPTPQLAPFEPGLSALSAPSLSALPSSAGGQ